MIVCSCNRLSDRDVRACCQNAGDLRTGDVYRALGCAPRCGRCVGAISAMLAEAKGGACESDCRPGLCACAVAEDRRAA